MSGSTVRQSSRFTALGLAGIALLLLAGACTTEKKPNFSITTKETRGPGRVLEGLTVEGTGFTPNGPVVITSLLTVSGGDVFPYTEEQIQAGGDGKFKYERRPLRCPPGNYTSGSWTMVSARDVTSGISGTDTLDAGDQPDCRGSG